MKKLILAVAVIATFGTRAGHAEDKKPDNETNFNVAVVSDYRFRGISQTRLDTALQGGADYTNNPTGLYAGTWLSSIKWIKDAGGSGDVELDIYGGKRGAITKDVSYDVGVLTYVYPSNGLSTNANTTEIYGQLGYGPAYAKYSHTVTNLFGFVDSKNSAYLDLGANIDMTGGYVLALHVGHQRVKNNSGFSYTDYKVGVNKEFFGVNFGLAAIGTDSSSTYYFTPSAQFTGKTGLIFSATKTF